MLVRRTTDRFVGYGRIKRRSVPPPDVSQPRNDHRRWRADIGPHFPIQVTFIEVIENGEQRYPQTNN